MLLLHRRLLAAASVRRARLRLWLTSVSRSGTVLSTTCRRDDEVDDHHGTNRAGVIPCSTPDAYGMGVEVSPLHALRFKSAAAAIAPPFHVSAMFAEAQPRGIKRKAHTLDDFSDGGGLDEEDDDEEEEDSSSSSSCSSASSTTGGGCSSGDDARSYSRRRHVVFNMSLCKLTRFRQAADPSLLRSVLVCNTLRALERDLGPPPPRGPEPVLSSHHLPHHHHHHHSPHHHHLLGGAAATGHHHLPPHQPYGAATPCHHGGYGDDYDRSCPGDNGSGRLTPFVRSESPTTPAAAAPPPPLWTDEDRLPSLNWSSVLNFSSGAPVTPPAPSAVDPASPSCGAGDHGCGGNGGSGPAPLYTLLPAHNSPAAMVVTSSSAASSVLQTTSSSSSSSSVASSSSSDEIFGDIDLSLYDFDLLSPLSPPHVKLAPVSAEDLMRSLAASQQQASECVVTTTAASPSAATCQLVASTGQQISFGGYKGLMGSAEDHVATVMS